MYIDASTGFVEYVDGAGGGMLLLLLGGCCGMHEQENEKEEGRRWPRSGQQRHGG